MGAIFGWIKGNPVRTMAVVTAVLGFLAPFVPAAILGGASVLIAAVLGIGVHELVTPVTTMVDTVTTAATEAATNTVKSLDESIVGTVGVVTPAAADVVKSTVAEVVGALGVKGTP